MSWDQGEGQLCFHCGGCTCQSEKTLNNIEELLEKLVKTFVLDEEPEPSILIGNREAFGKLKGANDV